jgi:hypothetical protein
MLSALAAKTAAFGRATNREHRNPVARSAAVQTATATQQKIRCVSDDGAQGRIRTTDTRIFSPLLYQLSYLGVPCVRLDVTGRWAKTHGPVGVPAQSLSQPVGDSG